MNIVRAWCQSVGDRRACRKIVSEQLQTARLQRLFAVACCREIWGVMTDERSRDVIEDSESRADRTHCGLLRTMETAVYVSKAHLAYAEQRVRDSTTTRSPAASAMLAAWECAEQDAEDAAVYASELAARAAPLPGRTNWLDVFRWRKRAVYERQGVILESFGRWLGDTSWRTADAVGLADAIYDRRNYDVAPYLADALQDAGCDDESALATLRDPGFPLHKGNGVVDFLRSVRIEEESEW